MSTTALGTVSIKTQCAPLLKENLSRIKVIFSAQLTEKTIQEQGGIIKYDITAPIAEEKIVSTDFINRVQSPGYFTKVKMKRSPRRGSGSRGGSATVRPGSLPRDVTSGQRRL
ncbi:hypothetical protein Trydic_g3280 [Trypoxylus dichotomus]